MVRTKKAGLLTKLVVLILLIYLSITMLDLQGQIAAAESEQAGLNQEKTALTQQIAELNDALENRDNPEYIIEFGRENGLAVPGEKIFKIGR